MPINRAEKWPGPRCVTRLSPSPGREPGTEQGEGIPFAISLQRTILKKRGHGSRRMQCFTMEKWNASLEPHPQTHYIKGHTFWGGQRGCGYVYRQRRDEGQWYQHPVVVPHPQWDYIKQHAFGGGRVSSLGARLPPHGLRCNWSPGDSVFAC